MTVDGLLNILLGVAIPFFLAVAGGYLAVKDAKGPEKWRWVSLFVALLIGGIGLSLYQQIRLTNEQKEADQKTREANERAQANQNRLEGGSKYTQGQLDSIHSVLRELVAGGGNATNKNLVQALAAVTGAIASKVNGPVGLKGLSNAELRDRVLEMTRNIDVIEQQYEQDSAQLYRIAPTDTSAQRQAVQARDERENQNFQPIRVDAQMLYEEMLSRLPIELTRIPNPPTLADLDAQTTRFVLELGSLAGPYPLRSASAYMKKLAMQLPQPVPPKKSLRRP
jgi:hypothetical protein